MGKPAVRSMAVLITLDVGQFLPFQGDASFVDLFCYLCLSSPYCLVCFLYMFVMFSCVFVTFPYGDRGQVWYLIVSIPYLCLLPYIQLKTNRVNGDFPLLRSYCFHSEIKALEVGQLAQGKETYN